MNKIMNKNSFEYTNNLTVIYEVIYSSQNNESETPSC